MTLAYPITLSPDDNGTLLVACPLLPIVATFGDDEAGARRHAVDAIETALASMISGGEDIPLPPFPVGADAVELPLLTELKVMLYLTLRQAGITRAELMRRLGWNRESVDRLFRLDHNSRLEQLDAAFGALGRQVRFTLAEAA